jgi:hypothetical protein
LPACSSFNLLSFDGKTLIVQAAVGNNAYDLLQLRDVNGDGALDVVLDQSDYMISGAGSNIGEMRFQVQAWDEQQGRLVDKQLALLPDAGPEPHPARSLSNEAVRLAGAGLWRDAGQVIAQAKAAASGLTPEAAGDTLNWNYGIIKEYTDAMIGTISGGRRGDGSVILNSAYYGDAAGAVDVLRRYDLAEVFDPDSPVSEELGPITSSRLADIVVERTTAWLAIRPELAAAHFLRGWAYALRGDEATAAVEIGRAVDLAPGDAFYEQAAAYLSAR